LREAGAARGDFEDADLACVRRGVEREARVCVARFVAVSAASVFAVFAASVFAVFAASVFAARSGRLLLRRCGRERGSALSRSEGRSSVMETRQRSELASNLKQIHRFEVTVFVRLPKNVSEERPEPIRDVDFRKYSTILAA
jgi:hypothetical protein